ncbi:hypothetical protein J2Z21_004197 [Streptomyces griseochromogenes]|uniref:Helix-turn-helix domain-containing protein n=1 Tax=Streptomyces griseochromogenes TaxID=68214 RepID=A0ABS4LVU4_9ACTN|nr:hypothetical protein [Streptomyces griseochromogenes]
MPKILTVELACEQHAAVRRRLVGHDLPRDERRRLECIRLLGRGLTVPQVADLVECNPVTVRDAVRRFTGGGFDALADAPRPGRPAVPPKPGPSPCRGAPRDDHPAPGRSRDHRAGRERLRLRDHGPTAARPGRLRRGHPARPGGGDGRPGGRLPAEHPSRRHRVPRHGQSGRGVVGVRPGLRAQGSGRPLRPARTHGAHHGGRLPLQRHHARPPRSLPRTGRRPAHVEGHGTRGPPGSRPARDPAHGPDGPLGRCRHPYRVPHHHPGAVRPPLFGSSCPPAPRACRRASSTDTAASCSNTSRSSACTATWASGTACSGTPPPTG